MRSTRRDGVALHWAHADGVAGLRLQGGLARALVPRPAPAGTRWSATPGAAAAAEQWLGMPVNVMSAGRARRCRRRAAVWNLRQFDLAQRTRGARALRDSAAPLRQPAVAAGALRRRSRWWWRRSPA